MACDKGNDEIDCTETSMEEEDEAARAASCLAMRRASEISPDAVGAADAMGSCQLAKEFHTCCSSETVKAGSFFFFAIAALDVDDADEEEDCCLARASAERCSEARKSVHMASAV